MAKNNEEEKDKAALIILPIFLGGAAAWYFLRKKVSADPNKAILEGTVTDDKTDQPINGVSVACGQYTGKTNPDGFYRIINIEPGEYYVSFQHPNYYLKVV